MVTFQWLYISCASHIPALSYELITYYSPHALLAIHENPFVDTSGVISTFSRLAYELLPAASVVMASRHPAPPSVAEFQRVGRIMMAWTLKSEKSPEWNRLTQDKTSDEWFDILNQLLVDSTRAVFDHDTPPKLSDLLALPFTPDAPGVYSAILTPRSLDRSQTSHVYPGCAIRAVSERTSEHNTPYALVDNPNNKYYQLRHGTRDYDNTFITLVRIPIDGRMPEGLQVLRRLLCRLAETFFTIWLAALDPSSPKAANLLLCARNAYREAYGTSSQQLVSWGGLATHTPLKEQTAIADYRVVAIGRYETSMQSYAEYYGGREKIPDEIEALVKKRCQVDTVDRSTRKDQRKRNMTDEQQDAERAHQKKQKLERREKLSPEEAEALEENSSSYMRAWNENRRLQMTEQDMIDMKADNARKTRKHKCKVALEKGEITQQQYELARTSDWFRGRGRSMSTMSTIASSLSTYLAPTVPGGTGSTVNSTFSYPTMVDLTSDNEEPATAARGPSFANAQKPSVATTQKPHATIPRTRQLRLSDMLKSPSF